MRLSGAARRDLRGPRQEASSPNCALGGVFDREREIDSDSLPPNAGQYALDHDSIEPVFLAERRNADAFGVEPFTELATALGDPPL